MSAYIEAAAIETLRKYKTADPFEILDLIKADVQFADMGTLRGLYHYVRRNVYVYIDCRLDLYNKKAVAAHELAHYVLHRTENRLFLNSSLYSSSRFEREANEFAAYLMWYGGEWQIEEFLGCSIREISCYTKIPSHYLELILRNNL